MSKFTNNLSKEIFDLTYRYKDETLDQLFKRVADDLASVEQDQQYWSNIFYETLKDFKFVPGGRILSNAGTDYNGTSYINCFVDGFQGKNQDSMYGIMDSLKRQALILKSEGGYGINMDTLRPRGMYVEGIGNETPGAVKMLEMWDTQSDVITAGSGKTSNKKEGKKKIRKGAQMCTLSCWHGDIEEFITAKQTPGRLSKFNMSVLVTDKFMDAVINHKSWYLEHPDMYSDQKFVYNNKTYTAKQLYDEYWDGNLEKWKQSGWPTKVLKTYKDANELWDLIMKSTYNRNEPGVLFVDTINRMNNLYYEEYINATNPCVVGDTLVFTNMGWIKIKNLESYKKKYPGLKIVTSDKDYNITTSELEWVGVTQKQDDIYRVNFSNGEFMLVNKTHKFYNKLFEKVRVDELQPGIKIYGYNQLLEINNVTDLKYKDDVWDLTANPNYNFFSIYGYEENIMSEPVDLDNITTTDKFLDNNFDILSKLALSVDCGEQILPIGGVCLLGSINLTQFLNTKQTDFDYNKLAKYIPIIVRMMDNVNDLTYVPLDTQRENLKNKRRLGLGIMGYASSLLLMKIPYGSKKALDMTDKFMKFYTNQIYQSSAKLANEKGSFPLYDKNKYLDSNFIKTLEPDTIESIKKYGIRNSHVTSIAPTGNTSIFANSVSGGLEPIFMHEYYRTAIIPEPPEGLELPRNIDWVNKKFEITNNSDWKWIVEGDENLLTCNHDDTTYKLDKNRGLTKVYLQEDYAVRKLKDQNEWDPDADWALTTTQLDVETHIKTMEIFSKYIDSSISKTINLPKSYKYDDFKTMYLKMYQSGTIKGGTSYRDGTMSNVLSSNNNFDDKNMIENTQAPKRPKTIDCDIYHTTAIGKNWVVLVGLLNNDPYEVWAFKSDNLKLSKNLTRAKLTKVKKNHYNLSIPGVMDIENIKEFFDRDEQEVVTLLLSWGLRHGGGIEHAVKTLNKSGQSIVSFSKAIARTLKRYIKENEQSARVCPECKKQSLIISEGCETCSNCGYSAC